jgi:hypothetical protein
VKDAIAPYQRLGWRKSLVLVGRGCRLGADNRICLAFAALGRGEVGGHAAGFVFFLCMGAGIVVANTIGVGTVGMDVVQTQLATASGPPLAKGLALVGACFLVYGFIPSVQALICGALLEDWLDMLRGRL